MLREFRSGRIAHRASISVLLGSATTIALLSMSSPAAAVVCLASTTAGNLTATDGSCVAAGTTIDNSTATNKTPITMTTGTSGNRTDFTNAGTIHSVSGSTLSAIGTKSNNYVSIINSGTIQSDASNPTSDTGAAIRLGTGISIDNSGTISASGKPAATQNGYTVYIGSGSVTNEVGGLIVNTAGATVAATVTDADLTQYLTVDSNVYALYVGKKGASTVTNYGTIRATGNAASTDADPDGLANEGEVGAVRLGDPGYVGTVLQNYGTIETTGQIVTGGLHNNDSIGDMYGVRDDGKNDVIYNYAGATITGGKHGITIDKDASGTTIYNWGAITGENGSGVGSDATDDASVVSVYNYAGATITGTWNQAAYIGGNEAYSFGDGDGVDIDHIAYVENYGTIQGTGAHGIKPGETDPSMSEGLALGGGTVINGDASHTSALISGANYGITVDDSANGDAFGATSITNYGTIQGLDGYAIKLADDAGLWSNSITNYGTISGTSATSVMLGNGDDTFNNFGGSVTGVVDAEGGSDTLNIDRGDIFVLAGSNWINFEKTNVKSGLVTLSGDYTTADAFTVFNGAGVIGNDTVTTSLFTNNGAVGTGTDSTLGTFSVDGDYAQGSTGSYFVKINGTGSSDLVDVTGNATLNGAVTVSSLSTHFRSDLTYTILQADSRTGTFSSLVDNIDAAFVAPTLSYTSNAVLLGFERNGVSYRSVANTPNGYAVAGALDNAHDNATGDLAEILAYIDTGTEGEAANAFNQMAPDNPTAPANQALIDTMGTIGSIISGRLDTQQAAMGNGGTRLAASGADGDLTASLVGNTGLRPEWAVWARGFGLFGNASSDAGLANGYDYRGGGVVAGLDRFLGDTTVIGLSASYAHANVDHSRAGSSSDVSTFEVGAYGDTSFGAFNLSGRVAAAYNDYGTSRRIVFGGLDRTAAGSFGGYMLTAQGEAGYRVGLGERAWLKPVAGLDIVNLHSDSYTETGAGGLNLAQDSQSDTLVRTSVGAAIGTSFEAPSANATVSPSLDLRWGHDVSQPDGTATASFASTPGSSFVYAQKAVERDALLANLGVTATSPGGLSVGLAGTSDIRSDAKGYGLSLKLLYAW